MSTSSANSDDRVGQVAHLLRCAKDEGLLNALSSAPDFTFADATGHPVDRKSDFQAERATGSTLEGRARAASNGLRRQSFCQVSAKFASLMAIDYLRAT